MAKRRTSQKHAQLKQLSKTCKETMHERLRLTDEILRDNAYVDKFGGEPQLMEALQADEWSDFAGRPGLPALLKAYRANPDRATWQEYKHDWQAMIELANPETDREPGTRHDWKAECMELKEKVKKLEAENEFLRSLIVPKSGAA